MEESGGGWRRLEDAGRGSLTAQCRGRVPAECGGRWWCACSQCNLLLLLLFSSFSSSSSPLPPLLALATCILAEGRRVEAWGISLFRCWAGTSPSICTWKFPLGFSPKIYIFFAVSQCTASPGRAAQDLAPSLLKQLPMRTRCPAVPAALRTPRVWCRHCMACHGFFGSLPRISPISLLPVLVRLELAPNENRVTCGDLRVRPNQRVLPEASQIQVIFFSFGS